MYIILRMPVLMEDEGRYQTMGAYMTREEANDALMWLTADGYFSRGDFEIREV